MRRTTNSENKWSSAEMGLMPAMRTFVRSPTIIRLIRIICVVLIFYPYCVHRATVLHLNGPSKLACFPSLGGARMLVYVRPSNEALLRARVPGAHRPTCVFFQSFLSSTFLLYPERKASPQEGGQVAPPLRVSNEHCFIVRVPRARGAPGRPHNIFRTSFHAFATFALRGASPLAGSGTI